MEKDIEKIALEVFQTTIPNDQDNVISSLLTKHEKVTVGRRIIIAQGILAGKTRFEINEYIKVSPNTFTQINRWLESELGDYHSAHKQLKRSREFTSKRIVPFSFEHLKRNFPMHFILFTTTEKLLKKK